MPFVKTTTANLIVGPLELVVDQGTMPPDEIRLWEKNPRIKHLVAQKDSFPSEEDLVAAIEKVQPHSYRNLQRDIEKFGQQEPVFVRTSSDQPVDSGTVIEGNTRVAILKDLQRRYPEDKRFASVKVYLLPAPFSDRDLAVLTANYHVKGTLRNQWDRYQIGAFIHEEVEVLRNFTQAELAEKIGKSPSWVSRHLTVYRFAVDYRDVIETEGLTPGEAEEETNDRFSLLEEAWKVKKFRDQMDDDPEARETLFRWIHDRKFKDHRAIRPIYDLYNDPGKRQDIDEGDGAAGDDAAKSLGKSVPLHEDLDRLSRRIDAIQLGDLASIDPRRVAKVREKLAQLEATLSKATA